MGIPALSPQLVPFAGFFGAKTFGPFDISEWDTLEILTYPPALAGGTLNIILNWGDTITPSPTPTINTINSTTWISGYDNVHGALPGGGGGKISFPRAGRFVTITVSPSIGTVVWFASIAASTTTYGGLYTIDFPATHGRILAQAEGILVAGATTETWILPSYIGEAHLHFAHDSATAGTVLINTSNAAGTFQGQLARLASPGGVANTAGLTDTLFLPLSRNVLRLVNPTGGPGNYWFSLIADR